MLYSQFAPLGTVKENQTKREGPSGPMERFLGQVAGLTHLDPQRGPKPVTQWPQITSHEDRAEISPEEKP